MKEYWKRFENWIELHAPFLIDELNPGASQAEIDKFETLIGKKLPKEFVEFYMIHNGQRKERCPKYGFIDHEELFSLGVVGEQWSIAKQALDEKYFEDENGKIFSLPDKGIKNDWWNPCWIPFVGDFCGHYICLDLDPSEDGFIGQVIEFNHDNEIRELLAPAFIEWFSNYVRKLESGEMVYSKKWGIVNKDGELNKP
ncbi:MAG TPA: SMI1/KNR4 family protein [Chitinophagaceae bacterium]|nr:SMI1/KNR4 family protein [Chitinophagaceae bacterium]